MTSEPNRKIKLSMNITLETIAIIAAAVLFGAAAQINFLGSAFAQGQQQEQQQQAFNDHVFVANELSNTISVINPKNNTLEDTIDLTGFDNRKPFSFNASTPLAAMHLTPLYNGAIDAHGMNSSPDGKLIAVTARGSSNIYLINTTTLKKTGSDNGIFVGREPHVPTFTLDGKSIWTTVRGSNYIAVTDVNDAIKNNQTFYNEAISTVNAPSMIWFSKDGRLAFVGSQKESVMDVIDTTSKKSIAVINLTKADPIGFTPFVKVTPDGREVWLVHKSADAITVISTQQPFNIISTIKLEKGSRPNHVEFAGGREDNGGGRGGYAYVTLAAADPKTNTSKVMIIDTNNKSIIGSSDSHGKEAHGIWANPNGTRIYVGHEQTPVLAVFDINGPNAINPKSVADIALGGVNMPNGQFLPSKKSIDVVYDHIIIGK
jgi:YVTN family beta-propeller protein